MSVGTGEAGATAGADTDGLWVEITTGPGAVLTTGTTDVAGPIGAALWVASIVETGTTVVETAIVDVCKMVEGAEHETIGGGQLVMVFTDVAYTVEVLNSGTALTTGLTVA